MWTCNHHLQRSYCPVKVDWITNEKFNKFRSSVTWCQSHLSGNAAFFLSFFLSFILFIWNRNLRFFNKHEHNCILRPIDRILHKLGTIAPHLLASIILRLCVPHTMLDPICRISEAANVPSLHHGFDIFHLTTSVSDRMFQFWLVILLFLFYFFLFLFFLLICGTAWLHLWCWCIWLCERVCVCVCVCMCVCVSSFNMIEKSICHMFHSHSALVIN